MSQTTALIQGQREEKKIIIALLYLVICNKAKASMSLTKQTPTDLPFHKRKAIIHPLFCFFFFRPFFFFFYFLILMEYVGSRHRAWMDISKPSNFIKRCLWWGRVLILNIQQLRTCMCSAWLLAVHKYKSTTVCSSMQVIKNAPAFCEWS